MFIIASDWSEAQRERLSSSFSLKWISITACNFWSSEDNISGIILYAEKFDGTSFTPRERTRQQHEQNLHCGRLLKTTLDNGPKMNWLVSKAALMMNDHGSGHGPTLSVLGSPDHSRAARWKEEKEMEKESTKENPKEAEEPSSAMNNHKILVCGQKRISLGGPKDAKARKACQKAMMVFRRVVFALHQPDEGASKDYIQIKGKGKYQKKKKRKGEEEAHPQSGLSISEAHEEEGCSHAWESDDWSSSQWPDDSWNPAAGWCSTKGHTDWMALPSLNIAYHPTNVVLDLGGTRSIGSRSAIERFQKHSWYCGFTTELCHCNKSFVFANSETETCSESCIIHFPTTPPVHPWLRQVMYFPIPKKFGYDYWTGSSRRQAYMPSFWFVFFLQLSTPQWDILCWAWRVLRISLPLNRVLDLVTQRDM